MESRCMKLLDVASTKWCTNTSYPITSHGSDTRFETDRGLYLNTNRAHLAYYSLSVPTEYLIEERLTELLSESANKTPTEWENEFDLLCASKEGLKNSLDLVVEKQKAEHTMESYKTPKK